MVSCVLQFHWCVFMAGHHTTKAHWHGLYLYNYYFCLGLTGGRQCWFYLLISLNKAGLKKNQHKKTDADLFIVIHKLALKPKTNTVEPLMQGSHNKSWGWLLNDLVSTRSYQHGANHQCLEHDWRTVEILRHFATFQPFRCNSRFTVSQANSMLWLMHV